MNTESDYRDSHTASDYGEHYQQSFESHCYRKYIWDTEKHLLTQLLSEFYDGKANSHLDFACGTGRILSFLESKTNQSTGVDVSESMLEIARSLVDNAKLLSGDITKNNVLGNSKFDLITAFRFFLRAQPSLRDEVMSKLVEHLTEDGFLIFNIHNNRTSISNNISKIYTTLRYGKPSFRDELSVADVQNLTEKHGLEIIRIVPYCTFPVFREEHKYPGKIIQTFNSCIRSKLFSTYLIYVCKKTQ